MSKRHQVVIVGGGPVGVALAVELGLRGISCALVERRLEPQLIPKGQNLTQRSMEHFHSWGVADEVRAVRLLPPEFPMSGIVSYRDLNNEYWYAPPLREIVNSYYFEPNERLPQYLVENVLRKRHGADSAMSRRGSAGSPRPSSRTTSGVRVTIAKDGAKEIAGSGLRGRLRRQPFHHPQADRHRAQRRRFRSDHGAGAVPLARAARETQTLSAALDLSRAASGPERLLAVLRPGRCRRTLVLPFAGAGEHHARQLRFPRRCWKNPPASRSPADFDYVGFWDLRIAVAETYQVGRVFIAGDAAHSHPPYGGYGLNNGLDDVANLGWKLAAKLKGWGSDALLAELHRRAAARSSRRPARISSRPAFRRDADFLARYSPDKDRAEFERAWKDHAGAAAPRVLTYEPHYEGSPIVFGPPGAASAAPAALTPSRPAPAITCRRNSCPPAATCSRSLAPDFTLLAFDADDRAVRLSRRPQALQRAAENRPRQLWRTAARPMRRR